MEQSLELILRISESEVGKKIYLGVMSFILLLIILYFISYFIERRQKKGKDHAEKVDPE